MCVMSYLSQTAHAFAKLTRYDPFEQNPDILEYFGPGTSRTDSEKLMSGWIDPKTLEPIEMLDLRVGKITKVWKHENSTKLYCEEVDLGEEQPRQIASGLQEFVPIERMQNSMVVVAANLKPRRVAGFMSHGMILWAENTNKTEVELLIPPSLWKPGDKITVKGYKRHPLPILKPKKKIFESVVEDFFVDSQGIAKYKDAAWETEHGNITASLITNGIIR